MKSLRDFRAVGRGAQDGSTPLSRAELLLVGILGCCGAQDKHLGSLNEIILSWTLCVPVLEHGTGSGPSTSNGFQLS